MRVEERVGSGKVFWAISETTIQKETDEDERGGSEVYDVREEKSAMGAC
jgi:hypothetical protein